MTRNSSVAVVAGAIMIGGVSQLVSGGGAVAHADTPVYLGHVRDAGINPPGGDFELLQWGWEVCLLFKRGRTPEQVVLQAVYNSASTPPYDMTEQQANTVVDIAVRDLCVDRP